MAHLIRTFDALTAEQHARAGSKGATLARLYQAGYPAPDGFVILPAAFAGDDLKLAALDQIQALLARLREGGRDVALAVRCSTKGEDATRR
jgi:pyruvate,water dikinase